MNVEVFSDPVCPWCFIGKRRYAAAAAQRPALELRLQWRTFQLNPDMPADGMPRQQYLETKFGGAANAARIYRQVAEAGLSVGIEFAFERIRRTPNTVQAHRLIRLAQQPEFDRADAVADGVFEAYFLAGEDIGDRDTLVDIGARAGLDRDEVNYYLVGEQDRAEVLAEDALARRMGVSGVPCFVLEGRYAIAGAHEPDTLVEVFDRVAAEHQPAPPD